MSNAAWEPEMIPYDNEVCVVKPTVRFPIGQNVLIGNTLGVVVPSVPLGPKGAKIRAAMKKFALVSGKHDAELEKNLEGKSQVELLQQLESLDEESQIEIVAEAFDDLYKTILEINYDAQTVAWIMDTIPVTMSVVASVFMAVQGEKVDEGVFR